MSATTVALERPVGTERARWTPSEPGAIGLDPLSGRDIIAFIAAVDTGSVQGAADALCLTQSAATKRIQALERRLGMSLLDRGRTGVRLTAAGRAFHPAARRALVALEQAERVARDPLDGVCRLRLAASPTVGDRLLPPWLARFRASHPEVHVQLDIANSPEVLRRVRDEDAAIGFAAASEPMTFGLETVSIAEDEIVAVVHRSHRWSRRSSVRAQELAHEPYITREAESVERATAEAALRRGGVVLRSALETTSVQSVTQSLVTSGFALLSRLAVEQERRAGVLRTLTVEGVNLRRELYAVRLPRRERRGTERLVWRSLTGGCLLEP